MLALVQDGGNLTVENCWFKGFQTGLEIHLIGGSTTLVRQTMVVPATRAVADSSAGWGFRMQFMGGNLRGSSRRLILEHCTVAGSGLLQLADFPNQYPLQIEVRECAIQTNSLIAYETTASEPPPDTLPLQWKGRGNQLEVTGASWIIPSGKGTLAPALQNMGRDGWSKFAKEEAPVMGKIQFSSKHTAGSESTTPTDYRIEKIEPGKIGANPEEVGPNATSLPHSTL